MSLHERQGGRKLGLLLVDGFSLLSYAAIVEPFRAANVLAGETLYSWTHVGVGGAVARASNGASLVADQRAGEPLDCEILFVFAGGDPSQFDDRPILQWLRRLAARGVELAGVSGGPYILARAGLLEGYRATVHWEHAQAMREDFPHLELENGLYVIDRRRMTCAGGAAGLDLAIELVERDNGPELARRVGEWFIRAQPRAAEGSQRPDLAERYGVRHPGVVRALAAMEATIAEPGARARIAEAAGVSVRQLERLMRMHMRGTVAGVHQRIRLEHARRLLRATGLSVTQVAVDCGFVSGSHFARAYRRLFGRSPTEERGRSF